MAPSMQEKSSSSQLDQDLELAQVHDELLRQSLCFVKAFALAVALDLRIPDAIHRHGGGGATLPQILAGAALHPSKLRALRRLMRALTVTGTFTAVVQVQQQQPPPAAAGGAGGVDGDDDDATVVYRLTAASRFLVSDDEAMSTGTAAAPAASLAPLVSLALQPIAACPHVVGMCAWFRQEAQDPSPYGLGYRQAPTIWEHADDVNALLNRGMAADSRFLMPIVLRECGAEVFGGVGSLVDVGGGHGAAAAAIAAAFPHVQCSVLDLPHVVAGAPTSHHANVRFVAGNMFQSIPPATAVFLKKTLHDWGDDECVKILKNCRQAIPPRDAGGKVIIMDVVVGYKQLNIKHLETQVLFDLYMMAVNGVERDEKEWKKIFVEAGFKDYKILPVIGDVSVIIEVYP